MPTSNLQKNQPQKQSDIRGIIDRKDRGEIRSLFAFNSKTTNEEILFKFGLWIRFFVPTYVMNETNTEIIPDNESHHEADLRSLKVYRGQKYVFVDVGYRGLAKTTRKKLLLAYLISNDQDHYRKNIKVLAEDGDNSEAIVTSIYNIFINKKYKFFYPEIFEKTPEKRVERMGDFECTKWGVRVASSTVGVSHRGKIQDEARPDLIWFDDFETKISLRSAVVLKKISDNMEEARTSLTLNGGCIYTCNYVSERGNVHKIIEKNVEDTMITPIKGKVEITKTGGVLDVRHIDGPINWPGKYTPEIVENILEKAEDPEGEYLCTPGAGADIYFERKILDKMERKQPERVIAGFKIFHEYDPSHRYGSGHDVAGGVGLDSSTSVFIDFTQMPARVVATFKSNTIKPSPFGDEMAREADFFGRPIVAPENNKFDAALGRLMQIYDNVFVMPELAKKAGSASKTKQFGWNTNSMSKGTMMSALTKAISNGHLELSDPDLIAEARAYSRNDLMDNEQDPRIATRHFDLLIACAIAWQTKDYAEVSEPAQTYTQSEYIPESEYEQAYTSNQNQNGITPRMILPEEMQPDDYIQPAFESETQSDYES